ncbi:DEAD/DEAH box helicase [Paenibacillus sp. Marseille-P2973]|nr:protein DpdJ [Paenibacillus sp. Marseille-P2973]MBQ4899855.1 DEAD/DEAH box helicase [Paenibacillus sp. Marseille-P2973]
MVRPSLDIIAEEVLSQLERNENRLLEWGFIGGAINAPEEIKAILDAPPTTTLSEFLQATPVSPEAIIKNLEDRKLLFQLVGSRYRTRYAETIRLLYLLKQRFSPQDWRSGRNLVSHIKPHLSYRKYPLRDQSWADVESLLQAKHHPVLVRDVLYTLLQDGTMNLARFQVDAVLHLMSQSTSKADRGTVVGAGTGSGKTKAFYLPVFANVVELVSKHPDAYTKVIGIYPRVELLKDQFCEAISEMTKINALLQARNIRTLTIGSYYGDTPQKAIDVKEHQDRKWVEVGGNYVCPFFTCPECGSSMLWKGEDLQQEIANPTGRYERLFCQSDACTYKVDSQNVLLTRERMLKQPPDIIFTSTEMLNRKMTSGKENHLFGIRAIEMPHYVLLDEVHIYEGVTGAHVAYLLRRWRNMVGDHKDRGIQFVGLSATLSNPEAFFSQLTGLAENQVTYLTPSEQDLTIEGMEYNLVLRGDPFSSASLLSTSVQTSMLLARMLDPLDNDVSRGAMGSKLFGFTDKLDVINRWYHIEIDAEKRKILSKLRDPDLYSDVMASTFMEQSKLGQVWNVAKLLDKYSLRRPLDIEITSSQHKGVKESAKLVIATSTLEVGYNDTKVGAVIQHKAPRNLASFLQRKGRAGRIRGMRPWMVVVTSAYGRDRYAYDYPELLFQPILNDLSLPIRNTYIQRIQMAFTLMDWLTLKLADQNDKLDVRYLLTPKGSTANRYPRQYVIHLIHQILEGKDEEFRSFLRDSLRLSEVELTQILWSPPRSFYFELLPTLLNQLETNFKDVPEDEVALARFVPRALFSQLDLSELLLKIPNRTKPEFMPIQSALLEFAPGNVSKRFVHAQKTFEAHWIHNASGWIDTNGDQMKSVYIETVLCQGEEMAVVEPYAFNLTQIPKEVSDRSTGYPTWYVELTPSDEIGHSLVFPERSMLTPMFDRIRYYSSDQNQYVKVTRYTPQIKTELKYRESRQPSEAGRIEFQFEGKKAAIGFQRLSDAIRFDVLPIDVNAFFHHPQWEQLAILSKPAFYRYLLSQDPSITGSLNRFEIDWLMQITLSSVVATAVSRQNGLREALEEFKEKTEVIAIRTLQVIYQSTVTDVSDVDTQEDGKVYQKLQLAIRNASLMELFIKHFEAITGDIGHHPKIQQWLKETTITTIAACLQTAIGDLLPDVNTEDLTLDIEDHTIWFSEGESGGLGIINKVTGKLRNAPGMFEELFMQSLTSCQRHELASALSSTLSHFEDPIMASLFANLRKERHVEKQQQYLVQLQKELDKRGLSPKREFIVSLSSKLLRGQDQPETDALRKDLHELWHSEERRIRCKIDIQEFTVSCLGNPDIRAKVDQLLRVVESDEESRRKQQYFFIESLLFNDCHDSCPECLEVYSPFQPFLKPSRFMLQLMVQPTHETVIFEQNDWENIARMHLASGKRLRVITPSERRGPFQMALARLLHEPIEAQLEVFYPFVERVKNLGSEWHYDLQIREVAYV